MSYSFTVPRYQGRNLGKEQELVDYMDSFNISDPYNSNFNVLQNTNCFDNITDVWCCASFRDPAVVPITTLGPPKDLLEIWSIFSPEMQELITNAPGDFISTINCAFTNKSNINSGIRYNIFNCMNSFRRKQQDILLQKLIDKKYFAVRTEPELIKEIETRQAQFPKHKIFTLLGSNYSSFVQNTSGVHKYHNTHPVTIPRYVLHVPVQEYISAIIAEPQIHTGQGFIYEYHINRERRRWRVKCALAMKLYIEVDPLIEEAKELAPPPKKGMERFCIE